MFLIKSFVSIQHENPLSPRNQLQWTYNHQTPIRRNHLVEQGILSLSKTKIIFFLLRRPSHSSEHL